MDMRRLKSGKTLEIFLVFSLLLLSLVPACRRENPGFDRNRAPETFITSAPPETLDTDYKVHVYWRGTDEDGIVTQYIWYMSDTVMTLDPIREPDQEILDWNPANRIADYLLGSFTDKTDSLFTFTGYDSRTGAMVNRQAFHIASVDDAGRIDPSPARLQFNARVTGLPQVEFWTIIDGVEKRFDIANLDTVAMFTPFCIKFFGTTINGMITGYRWSYGGVIYPDYNGDGSPDWLIPSIDPPETVTVCLGDEGEDPIPDGAFYFKVIARDEAGALSPSDIIMGTGIAAVVVNHDPDTRVTGGECFYTPQSTGEPTSLRFDFSDGIPDTLPYNSRLRVDYLGWDDPKDRETLENDPPLPIRFQFRYFRQTRDGQAKKISSWYPLTGAEDTNPCDWNAEPRIRDADSTTMRIGTFDYEFHVRSFDEQYRADGTPDTISFVGNYPPSVDSVSYGYYFLFAPPPGIVESPDDTIRIQWDFFPFTMGAALPFDSLYDPVAHLKTKYYTIYIFADGHDDPRDPPGSGVKGWQFHIDDPEDDYPWRKEGEWIFDHEVNRMEQGLLLKVTAPTDETGKVNVDSLCANPPLYLGEKYLELRGKDISDREIFYEGIRGITPEFIGCDVVPGDNWITQEYRLASVAYTDTLFSRFYIKLVP
jgi:hypothetical protein